MNAGKSAGALLYVLIRWLFSNCSRSTLVELSVTLAGGGGGDDGFATSRVDSTSPIVVSSTVSTVVSTAFETSPTSRVRARRLSYPKLSTRRSSRTGRRRRRRLKTSRARVPARRRRPSTSPSTRARARARVASSSASPRSSSSSSRCSISRTVARVETSRRGRLARVSRRVVIIAVIAVIGAAAAVVVVVVVVIPRPRLSSVAASTSIRPVMVDADADGDDDATPRERELIARLPAPLRSMSARDVARVAVEAFGIGVRAPRSSRRAWRAYERRARARAVDDEPVDAPRARLGVRATTRWIWNRRWMD